MDLVMHAIAIAALGIMASGAWIVRIVMYRTLRSYGVDPYSRGWRYAGSWSWVLKYREICAEHGLSFRYWNLLQLCIWSAGALVVVWNVLVGVMAWQILGY